MAFVEWDSTAGVFQAGSILRGSSSNDKVWGEVNLTTSDLLAGTFVAVNADGGVRPIAANTDLIHGIVVRDIYGDGAPKEKTVNVGHFGYGDEVAALAVSGITFTRGDKVYIVESGADAGKVTNVAAGGVDIGYWVTRTSGNNVVGITLAPTHVATAATGGV